MPALDTDPTAVDAITASDTRTMIYTLDGNVINTADTGELPRGIYIIKTFAGNTATIRKIAVK